MKVFKLYLLTILTAFSFGQIEDGCELPDLNLYITSSGEVFYNSSEVIGGFQFSLDGANVLSAGGGDAAGAGFVVQGGGSTVLGFSFTGGTIPAGCGTLTELSLDSEPAGLLNIVVSNPGGQAIPFSYYEFCASGIYDCNGVCDGTAVEDCAGECGGSAVVDECGICGGSGAEENFDCDGNCLVAVDCAGECGGAAVEDCAGECGGEAVEDCAGDCNGNAVVDCAGECGGAAVEDCAGECGGTAEEDACGDCNGTVTDSANCFDTNSIWIEWNAAGNLDVNMYNEDAVAGFQFNLSGVTLSGAAGGSSVDAGFTVQAVGSTVLGFSFTGGTIPAGNGLLTELTFTPNDGEIESCLENVVISDASGSQLIFEYGNGAGDGECAIVASLAGCTDETACNYNELANEDDGSCWYVGVDNDYCDCDMNVNDCAGECGGTAELDCAGECGGAAVEDCLGECGGTAELDCAGECNGDAVVDDCGDCNGNNAAQDCLGVCDGDAELDCAGECGGAAVEDCLGECGGTAELDCAGECDGDAVADACGECNGSEIDPDNCFDMNTLWIEWNAAGNLDVNMYNEDAVAGFQFDLSGVTLSGAAGGSAEAAGFTTSTAGATVLGFSFTGATIPPGNGLLTELTFTVNDGEFQSCLEDVVISDSAAASLVFDLPNEGCETVISLAGCTDETACNYNEFANEDDGSCWYAGVDNDYCDCDMNVNDCLGDCGGTAEVDCAGDCDGDAVVDCAGECGGTSEVDCAGECNGDAVADACGECNGSETDPNNCFENNTLWMELNADGDIDVYMYNIEPVAGFQFDVTSDLDGFSLLSATGGTAELAGFTVQAAGATVLGFSFSGDTIPEGLGILTTLDVDLGADPNGFVYLESPVFSNSAAGEMNFDVFDELMIGTPPYVDVSLINVSDVGAEVYITSTTSIAGFQFDLSAISDGFVLTDAFGGLADDFEFNVSSNASGTVVGFSLTGATIPPSDGVLISLAYEFSGTYALLDLADVTFSDSGADAIDFGVSSDEYVLGNLPPVPESPTNVSATVSNMINVNLSWDSSEYAEFYTVYRDGQSIGDTESLSFSDSALNYETSYVYWVTASNLMGESEDSLAVEVTTDPEPFDAVPPGNLVAEAGDAQVQLTWSAPSAGGGGNFPECTDGTGQYADCANVCFNNADCASGGYDCCVDDGNCEDVDGNAQIVDWLGDGYCDDGTWGMVFICDEYGNDCGDCGVQEDPLNVCGGEIFECTCDEGINNFSVSGIVDTDGDGVEDDCFLAADGTSSNYFQLNWEGCNISDIYWTDETGYTQGGNFGSFGPGLIFYGFGPSETYEFLVVACVGEDGETSSSPATGITSSVDCGSRTEPMVADNLRKEFNPSGEYNPSENNNTREELTGYNIYRGPVSGGYDLHDTVEGATTEYLDLIDVVNGQTYYYVVSALYDQVIESEYSNEANATPLDFVAPIPSNLTAEGGDSVISLDWNPVQTDGLATQEVFTGYNVYRSLTSGSGYSLVGTILDSSWDDTNVSNGTNYYYVVTAQFSDTESEYSNEAVAAPMGSVALTLDLGGNLGPFDQGEAFEVTVSMDNPYPVAGIELHLDDTPESVTLVQVDPAGVLANLGTISSSEVNGESIVLWFDFTGAVIEPQSGPVFTLTYQVNDDAPDGETIDLGLNNATAIADSFGNAYFFNSNSVSFVTGLPDVALSMVQTSETEYEILMDNTVDVSGFQFNISDTPDNYSFASVQGTDRTDAAGFTVSGSPANGMTVLAFSFTGGFITPGSGSIATVSMSNDSADNEDTEFCFELATLSSPTGTAIFQTAECATFTSPFGIPGCTDDSGACNYDPEATIDDGSCVYPEENYNCDGECIAEVDCEGVCGGDAVCLQYFTDLPNETGENSLVIIQAGMDLEPGDEVGLFDSNGILETCDPAEGCTNPEYGEILVGSGVWTGEQIEIVGIGSVDLSQFGGPVLNGYQDGNAIKYKVWKSGEDMVYDAEATYAVGSGLWGDILTAVSMLEPIFSVTQEVELSAFQLNNVSFNVAPDNMDASSVFGDIDLIIASDAGGAYYVPTFGLNQIGDIDVFDGYSIFPSGANAQMITVEGMPAELGPIEINPFQMNIISYLPQECMDVFDAFAGYEDQLLVVQDDAGGFYVPSFGVATLTEMCPGDGYSVFLNGANGIDFTYPEAGGNARTSAVLEWESYNEQSASVMYANDIVRTGISHPIILTSLEGMVNVGDEVVAYADGQVVGATRVVDEDMPVVIAAWGSYENEDLGISLPGYDMGDSIDLRLYSTSEGQELYVETTLDGSTYGDTPLTSGTAVVLSSPATPMAYELMQNYPNPFNPSTSIVFSLPETGHISLNIYDISGRLVSTLVDGTLDNGVHNVMWNGTDMNGELVSAGVYIYALESADMVMTKKMILMK